MSLKHAFSSSIEDGADTSLVRPSNWNAEHVISGWNDLQGTMTQGTGTDALLFEAYLDTPFSMSFLEHDKSKTFNYTFQLPHDWDNTSSVKFLGHFVPMVNPASEQVVVFSGSYAWMNLYNDDLPSNVGWTPFSKTLAVSTTSAFTHSYVDFFTAAPPLNTVASSMLCVNMRRDGLAASDTYTTSKLTGTAAANLGMLACDLHYIRNSMGTDAESPQPLGNATTYASASTAKGTAAALSGSGSVVISTLITAGADVFLHTWVTGSSVTASHGGPWGVYGSPTFVGKTGVYPDGMSTNGTDNQCATGSLTSYMTGTTGAWVAALVFKFYNSRSGVGTIAACGNGRNAGGYWIYNRTDGKVDFQGGGSTITSNSGLPADGNPCVLLWAVSGTSGKVRINKSAVVAGTNPIGSNSSIPPAFGNHGSSYNDANKGVYYEMYAEKLTGSWSEVEGVFDRIYNQVSSTFAGALP